MTPFILCFGKMKPRKFYSKIVRNFFARWKKSWCDMCRKWLYNYFLLSWLFLASTHRHISKHKKTEGKDHQTSQRNKNDNRDIRSQPVSFYSVEFFRLLFFSVFFHFFYFFFFVCILLIFLSRLIMTKWIWSMLFLSFTFFYFCLSRVSSYEHKLFLVPCCNSFSGGLFVG